ncbi:MAG: imidazole glycerol phosphate synthase subunit HisF [Oscillospiraceae bacterium]|nr:imidazole glycerol phosphate synthase subunit HisF [Oscillospiraceae bacterium]
MSYSKIIPCLDIKNGRVVKGVKFADLKDAGDPAEIAEHYSKSGADEIVFLDITATVENRGTMLDVIARTAKNVTAPITVGGGIRTVEDAQAVINAGANKVGVNSAAVAHPALISELADKFGSEKVVAAIDGKRGLAADCGKYYVCVNGGMKLTDIDAVEWAIECEKRGAGEILLTSFDADGTKSGYDLEMNRAVAAAVNIPVTASGGAGSLEDIYNALTEGKARNALVASLFHFNVFTVRQVKEYLHGKGINVDLSMY